MQIYNAGDGGYFGLKIDSHGRALISGVTETELESNSKVHGETYSWVSGTAAVDAADTGLLVKSTSDLDLHISGIWVDVQADTIVQVHRVTLNITPAGAAVTGRNWNGRASNDAVAVAKGDETVNVQGDIVWENKIKAASNPFYIDLQGAFILVKNESIGVDFVSAQTAYGITIVGSFEEVE